MEESVKSRTIEFVKAKGIKMKVFEERCGLSSGYVTSMRKGFGPDKLTGVLKAFPELNRNWLLYGEGKMLADDEAVANTDAIPEYDIDFSCGIAVMYADGSAPIVGSVRMPEYAGASAIVRATGSSMHPLISSGDKVIIKEIHNWAENIIYGQIYGIETEGGVRTIKRIRRAKEQGTIILEPINKAEFDDTPIRADTITKMWLVMGCIKQFV